MNSPTKKPNVLLVMVDQWSGKLLRSAGHPSILTPTLDHLARLGTRYSRAYSECPICIPARRTVMTGTSPRKHGDRVFKPDAVMPDFPLLAQVFRDAGYQAYATGKLHVYPPRDRIGFDDVMLAEEGRPQLGSVDDYDLFLADAGQAGKQFDHGMNNNDYLFRPWHLEERLHVTNWTTQAASRAIKRRDPTRPAFWHVSYTHPHPPLVPLASYLDQYKAELLDLPLEADWAQAEVPQALQTVREFWPTRFSDHELQMIRRAFYALCTHVDHQLRVLLGTLREEGELDNTVIMVCSDHGDMLGDFGLWAKRLYYEGSAHIPMILVAPRHMSQVKADAVDDRLVGLQDVMPTLLELAGIDIPASVEGLSMCGPTRREMLYGECREDRNATRMAHDGRHKLIWYPGGNHVQLFDLQVDPNEQHDVADQPEYAGVRERLVGFLVEQAYGKDLEWITDGQLVGFDPGALNFKADRSWGGQRGAHYPTPPMTDPSKPVGAPG
ncbi:sulfatase-like hydrolase/transferase [Comamonadaceae bacterium PP-2]